MSKKNRIPKSQYDSYQTRSRAKRKEEIEKTRPIWPILAGVAAIILIVVAVLILTQGTGDGETGRPLAELPATERVNYFDAPPPLEIDTSHDYQARISTEKGDILIDLYEEDAPITVNNFVFLARQGFYDGVTFHRVLDGFMAQGGDPSGTGGGGPGYTFADETDNGLSFDRAGLLAMANAGPNTNGSQFFITFAPTPHLDGFHTIFGQVVEGSQVLDQLTRRDPQTNPTFSGDLIQHVTILENGESSLE